jgi:P27 family predicted phage terminase small subunit
MPLLEAFCEQFDVFRKAMDSVHEGGITIKDRGGRRSNPWLTVANHAFDRMRGLGVELGLVPERRGRAPKVKGEPRASAKFVKRAA